MKKTALCLLAGLTVIAATSTAQAHHARKWRAAPFVAGVVAGATARHAYRHGVRHGHRRVRARHCFWHRHRPHGPRHRHCRHHH